ncbi:hypothetical protein GCM10020001_005230 [Nonomuraea salmonea]
MITRLNGPPNESQVDIVQVADMQLLPLHMPDTPGRHHIGARGAATPRGKPVELSSGLDPPLRTRDMQGSPLSRGTRDAELPTCDGLLKGVPVVGDFCGHPHPSRYQW